MNDKKFIELLNLYVDREISTAEAAELEQEISRNPQRRTVYQQYCRMHRASSLLAESFKSESIPMGSKLARAARDADEKVAHFPERRVSRVSWAWVSGIGVAAAAACVAFVVVRNDNASVAPMGGSTPVVAQHPALTTSTPELLASSAVQPHANAAASTRQTDVFRPASVTPPTDVVYVNTQTPAPSLDWMDRVQLPSVRSVPVEDLVFETKSAKQDPHTFRSDRPMQGKVEMTAFQFEK